MPFSWIFVAFGVFIFSCSVTHFMEVWTIWNATYWLSGYVKLLTAASSVATAVVLPFLVPKVLMLIQAVKLSEERRVQLERVGGSRCRGEIAFGVGEAQDAFARRERQLVARAC
jgi:hypothetical protein